VDENGIWNGMDSSIAENDRLLLHKTARKSNSREENQNTREQEGRTAVRPRQHDRACTTTGCPWWSLAQRFRCFPNAAFWCFALVCGFLPWIIRLGPIGLGLQPSLIHLALTSFCSPITWLDICKSEIKNPEQAKTSVIGEIGA